MKVNSERYRFTLLVPFSAEIMVYTLQINTKTRAKG